MKNLARHIEHLLRDNDCVILPGFGGFIAHIVPAYYVSEEHLYYPPSRSISFNASITMNDGLLAQSYMKSYQVDYSRATYMVDMDIEALRCTLDEEGEVTLPHIGIITQDIYQSLQFFPEQATLSSPKHFGLSSFFIQELSQLQATGTKKTEKPQSIITQTPKTVDLHISKNLIRQVVSTAAVLLLLLMVSLPIEHHKPTDIASLQLIKTNISLQQEQLQAMVPEEVNTSSIDISHSNIVADTLPAIITTDNIVIKAEESTTAQNRPSEVAMQQAPQAIETTAATHKIYHIIVASLPSLRGAEDELNKYANLGYANVSIVERDNRVRISLIQFTDKGEANEYLQTLRQNNAFQNAWLLAIQN